MIISLSPYTSLQATSSSSQASRTSSLGRHTTAKDDVSNTSLNSRQATSALARELLASKEASRSENSRVNRLNEALENMQRLQDMPKQTEKNKVGLHRQRIEMLKMLLIYASPKQAKAIAKELKSIAKDLVNVSKSLENSGGNSLPNIASLETGAASIATFEGLKGTGVQSVTAGTEIAEPETQEASLVDSTTPSTQIDSTAQSDVINDDASAPPPSNEATPPANNGSSPILANETAEEHSVSALADDDATLRGLLEEAQKLMKEAINALKMKLAEGDKEARKALADAEKSLDKLNGALSQSAGDSLYTALGSLLPTGSGASAAVTVSVSPNINITV